LEALTKLDRDAVRAAAARHVRVETLTTVVVGPFDERRDP
jgi:predicted Zn-dependent peptidase